jgi:adenylate cyclase
LAITLELQGELIAARDQFEETSRLYDCTQQGRYLQLYRLDPGIQAESDLVRVLWLLGFPDQARRKIEENLTRARASAIPVTLAFSQRSAAWHYQNLRQPRKAKEIGEACIALCDEHGILLERAWVECPYGWAVAEMGETKEGVSHIRAGLEAQLSVGAEGARPQMQAILAETLWHAGCTEEAFQAVEDGLAASGRNGDNFYDAELLRLKGEVLKLQDKTAEAESCFHKAIEVSTKQAAKSLELRVSTSLARLWEKQGKRKEAQQLLAEVYAWFTEGFDTSDLQEATSLLKELS